MVAKSEIAVASTPGLVSIVIPCCGMLEYTKMCVTSVLKHTPPPIELIFLDVGSLDGTAEFLAGLQIGLAGRIRVHVERAATDLGLRDACQRALRFTLGDYVALLNNDCIVTSGWLNQLIGLASFSMTVGLAGPMSNMAAPPQLIEPVPYRSSADPGIGSSEALIEVAAVERYAAEFHQQQKGNWMYAERLGGFCLLVKREVLDKVGSALDEWTDLGLFDTDILSSKAKQAGYTLAVCRDLFVHHFGTRTFAHGPAASSVAAPAV